MKSFENFSDDQKKILQKYVTNTDKGVFALHNLPEVIKGALFSRYSRSSLGLRSLLLKDFILNDDSSFSEISSFSEDAQMLAVQKAQSFYDRILDGYGDDSIGELGGAHLAIENISMLAAKAIEDVRIGGSPLEKSTRYIYFDQRVNGEFLFYKEPILLTSAYKELYLNTCNMLFETYTKLIPPLSNIMEQQFPKEENISIGAYKAALRAKVLDCLRGLLPSSALTNVGLFGNGRFYENLIKKLSSNNLAEMQEISKDSYDELFKIIPSFVRRSEPNNKHQQSYSNFIEKCRGSFKILSKEHSKNVIGEQKKPGITLVDFDKEGSSKVAAALLFENSSLSLLELQNYTKELPTEEIMRIFEAASTSRENRRHKSPRALEHAWFTFEIVADFGIYRDLQRHRMLTQERQLLTTNYGYFIPKEIIGTEMEKDYTNAMKEAKRVFDIISSEFPEEAQYVVPMAYNLRWYFHVNLRALQWLCELRSAPAGHPNYRYVAQDMAKKVFKAIPEFECFLKFVDFEGYDLGRMNQEIKRVEKEKLRANT
ncbi:MAG: FAD-dependent thymidylate synthase [Parachlamydiales bacterium]|nr:FAD-dependent thymidylate synthase [Parachlamydiales bacterium]